MAEVVAAAVGAGPDVNTAGNPTEIAMAYLQDEVTFEYFESSVVVKKQNNLLVYALFPPCIRLAFITRGNHYQLSVTLHLAD